MGNRCYISVQTPTQTKTYYMHWNGGLDTIAPVARVLSHVQANSPEHFERLLKALSIRCKAQNSNELCPWEENGHYILKLPEGSIRHVTERGTFYHAPGDLVRVFDQYALRYIREECRAEHRNDYWHGIFDAGIKEFINSNKGEKYENKINKNSTVANYCGTTRSEHRGNDAAVKGISERRGQVNLGEGSTVC